jgi:hypothetical protein
MLARSEQPEHSYDVIAKLAGYNEEQPERHLNLSLDEVNQHV